MRDRSKTPKHQPNKTSALVEDKVVEAKNKTRLAPERLSRYLKGYESLSVAAGTIRNILRRNKLRKLISGFGCRLIQNHKGHFEENAYLERSHRTEDDEFYIPRALHIKSEADLLNEAIGYIYYYDNLKEDSAINYQTPFAYLRSQLPESDDRIRFTIPIMLDKVSVQPGPWSGYHVLAQHRTGVP